ncbi:phosphotransferase family protein [Brevibacillus sp. NPDC003359]|uniref:phosphotransferase family protein n=1 Tax=unclassified Brevibacillus TaxID=2684853 RepID=UPI0036841B26
MDDSTFAARNNPVHPPTFPSLQEFILHNNDTSFWMPYITDILKRHDLLEANQELVAGIGGTYPSFLYGDVVVKLFGHLKPWHKSHSVERAAQTLLANAPEIAAPRLLAEGNLSDDANHPWPYLITTRMSGVSWQNAQLTCEQQLSVAADLGKQMAKVHALTPTDIATHADWSDMDVVTAAKKSSLPLHLVSQIDDYLASLGPLDPVVVHGDLMFRHVFVENGRLSGIIDWGDMMVTDRHYEFAKLHLDLFDCDKTLLKAFLEASNWPMTTDFAHKAMAQALYRQAHGLTQHYAMDVFYMLPDRLPLQDIRTLEELANELFAI